MKKVLYRQYCSNSFQSICKQRRDAVYATLQVVLVQKKQIYKQQWARKHEHRTRVVQKRQSEKVNQVQESTTTILAIWICFAAGSSRDDDNKALSPCLFKSSRGSCLGRVLTVRGMRDPTHKWLDTVPTSKTLLLVCNCTKCDKFIPATENPNVSARGDSVPSFARSLE
jgi:hypothetical protein